MSKTVRYKILTSAKNDTVVAAAKLRDKRDRLHNKQFLVEGVKELDIALANNFEPIQVFVCRTLLDEQSKILLQKLEQCAAAFYEINQSIFEKLAVRKSCGIIATFLTKTFQWSDISMTEPGALVILDHLEKPGNLGALLRTADAAGVKAIILSDQDSTIDPYNPNVIRASVGAVFTVPVIQSSNEQIKKYCKDYGFTIYAAAPQAQQSLFTTKFPPKVAYVLGSEAHGLSEYWQKHADQWIGVPMKGKIDSLNVSVAASILLYFYLKDS